MKIAKKRCEFCHEWFTPDPRTAKIQRSCAKEDCRKKRSNAAVRRWWSQNPDYNKSRGSKVKDWAKGYPDYWRKYRREHPDYVKKECRRMRSVRRTAKSVAKQNAIARISLEKLGSIRDLVPVSVAKQDAIARGTPPERQYEYAATNLGGDKAIESG